MTAFWSPTAPGKQKPGGASWFAELISAFGLDLTLAMSMGVNSESMAHLGLSVSPEVAMAALGVSAGEFSLAFSPALGMLIPVPIAASLELPLTPSIRMQAAEQYARSLGLVLPTSIAAAGSGVSTAQLGLSITPGFAMNAAGVTVPVAFDAIGSTAPVGGSGVGTSTITWNHTAHGPVLVAISWNQSGAAGVTTTRTVTYGGVPMASLGGVGANNVAITASGAFVEVFGLINPTLGVSEPVVATVARSGSLFNMLKATSVSYTGVTAPGTAVTSSAGASTALAVNVPTASGHAVFSAWVVTNGGGVTFSSSTGTIRFQNNASPGLLVADATGTGTLSVTTTPAVGATGIGGIGIDLSN